MAGRHHDGASLAAMAVSTEAVAMERMAPVPPPEGLLMATGLAKPT